MLITSHQFHNRAELTGSGIDDSEALAQIGGRA